MPLLDRNGHSGSLKVLSQTPLAHYDTVYNFEVQGYRTYHIGLFGVWVHNADCCNVAVSNLEGFVETGHRGTGKLHRVDEEQLIQQIGYDKQNLLKAKKLLKIVYRLEELNRKLREAE